MSRVAFAAAVLLLLVPTRTLANHTNPRLPAGPGNPANKAAVGVDATVAHLNYYGGPVLSNVQVVQVLYGTGTYAPQVANTVQPNMATFYAGVTNSAHMDWLNEYNTPTQTIGRGSFVGTFPITPSATNNGSTITDEQVQSELLAQVNAGSLPPADANTLYMIHFPKGKVILLGTDRSCAGSSGGGGCPPVKFMCSGFCAYHGTIAHSPTNIYYGVLPDMSAGSGCDLGCGSGTPFENQTSVASHELIEAVTDAGVGLAQSYGPPLAWYDPNAGEIGDICNHQHATVVGGDGLTYTVQREWSNAANACIVTRTLPNDFSIAISPSSAFMYAGTSATFSVTTSRTSGTAQSIVLSVSGLPQGVSGSLNPPSVTTGGASTLTLVAAGNAPTATATFTVTGTALSGVHTVAATIAVTANGFSLAVSPSSGRTLGPGGSVGYSVATAVTSGQAQTISLSVSGLPPGLTGTFSPSSVTAGQGSTLTVSASAGATAGTTTFSVRGTAASGSVSVNVPITVTTSEGYLDGADCNNVWGWAWDSSRPNTAITVDIYANGVPQASGVAANLYRADLVAAGKGNGYHAFVWPVPQTLKNGVTYSIVVKYGGTGTALGATPKSITCTPPSVSVAWVRPAEVTWGPAGTLTIAGYAQNGSGGVTALWRDVTFNPNAPWNMIPYVAPPDATHVWYNTIPNSNNCHTYQVYVTYSGVTSSVFTYNGPGSGYCHEAARVIWVQPQTTAGFGPPGSLIIAGSASGAPSGTGVTLFYRDVTAGGGWNQVGYVSPTDGSGIWYNAFPANFSHAYSVYIVYDTVYTGASPCTYSGNDSITWCP